MELNMDKNKERDKIGGVPIYRGSWGDAWKVIERDIGVVPMTKTQLGKAGYSTGNTKLPEPCAAVKWSKGEDGYLYLYDPREAVEKRKISDEQKRVLAEARHKQWHCVDCDSRLDNHERHRDKCHACRARDWARGHLASGALILDMETTGLSTHHDEACEIAIIDTFGQVHFDMRIKPRKRIPQGAIDVHGITNEAVADAPAFEDVWWRIKRIIGGHQVLIYNSDYDARMLDAMCDRRGLPSVFHWARHPELPHARKRRQNVDCVMHAYAEYVGMWSYKRNSYRWHPLPAGDHSARGDCFATLKVIEQMAGV